MISDIYLAITKKRFNRSEPFLQDQLKESIKNSVARNEPLKLVGFWGIGHKKNVNWAERETVQFFSKLKESLIKVHKPGVECTFVFASPHAVHNGVDTDAMKEYITQMERLFKQFNFKWAYLNQLWEKYYLSLEKIEKVLNGKPANWWQHVPYANVLEELAKGRNHRLPAKIAAQKYVVIRELEKKILEKEFAGHIFHTYLDARFSYLLPMLPTLHLYSYRKGRSESPWFIYEEKSQ